MINLIPQKAKRNLSIEYWIRVVSVWFTTWAVSLCIGASVLLPTYVLIGSQIDVYEASATAASEKVADYENVSTALVQASLQAKMIMSEMRAPLFSEYITLFEELQGEDVSLTQVSMDRNGGEVSPVALNGVADNRQSLASFRDRLLASEEVVSVDLPISNLARDKDIPFTLTVTLNNNPDI